MSARRKWAIALLSVVLSIAVSSGLSEAALRWALFHTSIDLAAKDPAYYARTQDELWVYRILFSGGRPVAGATEQPGGMRDSQIAFYRAWATSLQPDDTLGYARKPNVRVPCHETTSLATRGLHEHAADGPKIVFFGDSFVESAACSNDTLTTKLEALTGTDTLNYGVGGYGLDQILLAYERNAPRFDRPDSLVLVGLIRNDLDRILLTVRSAPKPYFTADGDRLTLHVDHLRADGSVERPPERFYLWYFLRGRLGLPVHAAYLRETRDERRAAVADLSTRLFDRFAATARASRSGFAFVLFPTPGMPFDDETLASMRATGARVIDLQTCLRDSGQPDTALYAELHPTSLGNDLLARCLVAGLAQASLLH